MRLTSTGVNVQPFYDVLAEHDNVIDVTPASDRSTTTMTITAIVLTSKSKNPLRRAMTIVNEIYTAVNRKVRTETPVAEITIPEPRVLA